MTTQADTSQAHAHHFKSSREFNHNERLCGDCGLPYLEGSHIEITKLSPFTTYVCPVGSGLGHSSIHTGAYRPELRTLRDHLCSCGAEYVVEGAATWRLSWEHIGPWGSDWTPVSNVQAKQAAEEQRDGLLALITRGESIRNVVLTDISAGPPQLLAENAKQRAALDAVLLLHDDEGRRRVGFPRAAEWEQYCTHCGLPAPCPTASAIAKALA